MRVIGTCFVATAAAAAACCLIWVSHETLMQRPGGGKSLADRRTYIRTSGTDWFSAQVVGMPGRGSPSAN
jgi:hypothetical protein